jgi:hypothetical protein
VLSSSQNFPPSAAAEMFIGGAPAGPKTRGAVYGAQNVRTAFVALWCGVHLWYVVGGARMFTV